MYVINFKNYNVLRNISRSVVVHIEYYCWVYTSIFFNWKMCFKEIMKKNCIQSAWHYNLPSRPLSRKWIMNSYFQNCITNLRTCVCVCVLTCMCVCVCMLWTWHIFKWNSKVPISQCFPQGISYLLFETASLVEHGAHQFR